MSGDRQYLFNLEHDPGEHQNLLGQQLEMANSLRSELEQWSQALIPVEFGQQRITPVAAGYFDYYLEGKQGPKVSPKKPTKRRNLKSRANE